MKSHARTTAAESHLRLAGAFQHLGSLRQADDPKQGADFAQPLVTCQIQLVCKFKVKAMDLLYEIFEELRVMFRLYVMSASKRGRHVKQ